MRVLYCNKYNYPFSGTEVYLFEVMDLMKQRGHDVALFSMADSRGDSTPYDQHFVPAIDFKCQASSWQRLRNGVRAIYSRESRTRIRKMIQEFRPDVAHVRNIYHHLTPSILWELKAQNVPVIYHINDFKLLCPSYNLVANGEACEKCSGARFRNVIGSACYPGVGARFALAVEAYVHHYLGSYRRCVDRFLAPSRFVRDKFVEHGWDAGKFDLLPHFQSASDDPPSEIAENAPLLYFGRLSAEKGLTELLYAMLGFPQLRLIIAGDGPMRDDLHGLALSLGLTNVEFVGHVQREALSSLIARSRFTIFPSHAYETLGKSILESYAYGRAVIASDAGSRREVVHEGKTGVLYSTGKIEKLAAAIDKLASNPELASDMGRRGWELVRNHYTPQSHYQKLLHIYGRALAAKRKPLKSVLISTKAAPPWEKSQADAPSYKISPSGTLSKRIKVAFIGGRGVISKYSGIESYYEEVGSELAHRGHEVTVYCRNYFTPEVPEHRGIRIVRLPTVRSKHFETVIHTFLSTLHVLTRDFDIVHYHALGSALFSSIPRMFGRKTIVTVQGLDWQRKKWGAAASAVLRLGERAAVRLPNATMVVSQTLQRHYLDQHSEHTFYVPNGGLLREKRAPKKLHDWKLDPDRYILFLGRLSPEKGCHILIDAYEQIKTDAKLVLAGAGSYCDSYSRQLRSHASDKIKILNWVSGDALDELLTNAMIFVLPSDLEGLSLALLDAMGAGVCVVASDIPENREVISGAGFTFERGNAADLAKRLMFLIANPSVRKAAAGAGRQVIEDKYQWSRVASEIEDVYRKVIGDQVAGESNEKSGNWDFLTDDSTVGSYRTLKYRDGQHRRIVQ